MSALVARYRHAYLLVALVLLILVRPFVPEVRVLGLVMLDLFFLVVLFAGVAACIDKRRQLWIVGGLAFATVVTRFVSEASDHATWAQILRLGSALLFSTSSVTSSTVI